MRQAEDLTKSKFDGFEIIAQADSDGRNALWKCRCKFCGIE